MDKLGTKPLGRMSRDELISEVLQTRGALSEARQLIQDLKGGLDAIGETEWQEREQQRSRPTH